MRVLVTGATGFLGGHVARGLQATGFTVRATGRDVAKGTTLGLPFQPARLDKAHEALEVCADQDAIVHCAGLSTPWGSAADFQRHNPMATSNLLRARVSRFVYISSAGVYFQQNDRLDVSEDDPLPSGQQHPYLQSKRQCEELIRPTDNWTILRPRAIYGPGDTALLPRLARLMRGGFLPMIGSGETMASLTYVDHLVQAVALALRVPNRGVYNICDGQAVALWPLLRKVGDKLGFPPIRGRVSAPLANAVAALIERFYQSLLPGREPPITTYTLSLLHKSQTLDIGKAQEELGYRPFLSTEHAVERTLLEYRA